MTCVTMSLRVLQDPRFDDIVEALELQKRGSAGEHTDAVDDTFDLSNAARLKKTEVCGRRCVGDDVWVMMCG